MNSSFKISIVVPVYNSQKFIGEAIDSILDQTISDLEIILVNDGSTDNSYEICKGYAEKNPNIKLLSGENRGVSVARNRGLGEAKGEYVFFMDSDDTIDRKFLSSSYEIAKKYNSDFVIMGDYFFYRLPNAPAFPTCAMFLRKSFLDDNIDIRFPDGIQPCEDGLFSHQLLAITSKVSYNRNAIYSYRQHEGQNHIEINSNCWKVLKDIPKWFEILENFYERRNLLSLKALHLALFLQHEPFELRYLGMPLDDSQKGFLYEIIKDFFYKKILTNLNYKYKKYLSKTFLYFLETENFKEFDDYCSHIEKKREQYLRNVNRIPIKFVRKKIERKILKKLKI